jgi:hypothetical protein
MVKKIIFIFILFVAIKSNAQNALLDDIKLTDYFRNKQLIGNVQDSELVKQYSFLVRSTSYYQYLAYPKSEYKKGIYISNFQFSNNFQNNSGLPISYNDGNMIPAKGFQERYSIGANIKWKALELNIQPEFIRAENLRQEVFNGNRLDNNWWTRYFYMVQNNVDDYRRFGNEPINKFYLGQSKFAVNIDKFAVGVSNENIWWGPGKRNALLFTNNAPGFLHAFVQTKKPIKTKIGNFEFNAIYGTLGNIDYIHSDDSIMRTIWPGAIQEKLMNPRDIQAFTINWNPKWMSNFFIGYSVVQQNYKTDSIFFTKNIAPEKNKMTLGTLMFRYVMPRDHAEFYAEIGQPDKSATPANFFNDNVKTGFVFGASKIFVMKKSDAFIKLDVEVTQLQLMDPRQIFIPGSPFGLPQFNSWYSSPYIRQGYTHEGQMLGAAIGPGSNSQSINLSWHKGQNKIGFLVERLVHNSDFYHYAYLTGLLGYSRADAYWVDINTGAEIQFSPIKNILIAGSYMATNAMNYRWVKVVNDISVDKFATPGINSDKNNFQFNVSVKYSFNGNH